MGNWRTWSQKLYDKYGQHLQSKYDKIRNTKTPQWYIALTETVWEKLETEFKYELNRIAIEFTKKFGDEFAKGVIADILKRLGLTESTS